MTIIYDLDCMTEEAGCRLILNTAKAGEEYFNIILVLSNDTDFHLADNEYTNSV